MSFNTQRRDKAKKDFKKDFYKLLYNAFLVKQWNMYEIV